MNMSLLTISKCDYLVVVVNANILRPGEHVFVLNTHMILPCEHVVNAISQMRRLDYHVFVVNTLVR